MRKLRYVFVSALLILIALFISYQHQQMKELQLAIAKENTHIQYLEQKDHMNDNRSAYMYMVLKDMGKNVTSVKEEPVTQVREEVVMPTTYNEPFTSFVIGSFFSAQQFVKNLVGVR